MTNVEEYDLVVLGSGEAGKYIAWTLAARGQRAAEVERRYLGGSCPNIACLPSKNIIYYARVISLLRRGMEFGVESTEWAVDMIALHARKRVMVAGRLEMHFANYQASGAKLVIGHGRFIEPRTIEIKLNESGSPIGFDFEWTGLGLLDRPGHVNLNYRTENSSERRMRLNVSEGTGTHRMYMGKVRVVGPRIDAVEAKALADGGKAIILDVVASRVWPAMARTIQGSIRMPPEEIKNRFGELPRDKAIIAYCTWPDEFTSARVASFLEKQGYRAFALRGGYMAWYKAGYPIERKKATAALPLDAVCPDCGQPVETHADH